MNEKRKKLSPFTSKIRITYQIAIRLLAYLDGTQNMGGDITGWSARQRCHYDERDLSQKSSQSPLNFIFYSYEFTNAYKKLQ